MEKSITIPVGTEQLSSPRQTDDAASNPPETKRTQEESGPKGKAKRSVEQGVKQTTKKRKLTEKSAPVGNQPTHTMKTRRGNKTYNKVKVSVKALLTIMQTLAMATGNTVTPKSEKKQYNVQIARWVNSNSTAPDPL
ncbi:MAG: hypothetical protein COB29_01255 [Sulfitobacter sp.]|nr:MAG: hypothetical protein COB29_01255 [Sulfitobacter sp.]